MNRQPTDDRSAQEKTPFALMNGCKSQVRELFAKIRAYCNASLPEQPTFPELTRAYRLALRAMGRTYPADFPQQIMAICRDVQTLCEIDADAAIGVVHLDSVSLYTTIHPLHKALLSELVATRLGIPPTERRSILAAALTANISIINLQESLHLQNRKPSAEERETIRLHPQLSYEMLQELGVTDELWMQSILQHHERCDGHGYPRGLSGAAIGVGAKILSLADRYSAMVQPHACREGLPGKEVLRRMLLQHDTAPVDATLHAFVETLSIYPPGSFVKLENGETAIVTRRGNSPASPQVKSVRDPHNMPLPHSSIRDTARRPFAISSNIPRDKCMAINVHALWGYDFAT